jgi:hypothetical protein
MQRGPHALDLGIFVAAVIMVVITALAPYLAMAAGICDCSVKRFPKQMQTLPAPIASTSAARQVERAGQVRVE